MTAADYCLYGTHNEKTASDGVLYVESIVPDFTLDELALK
jgi:hypothetical protein